MACIQDTTATGTSQEIGEIARELMRRDVVHHSICNSCKSYFVYLNYYGKSGEGKGSLDPEWNISQVSFL
jgi:hypothetical protein